MNNIESSRSSFFPNTKTPQSRSKKTSNVSLKSNTYAKQIEIDKNTGRDAKVQIPDAIKDFSKIKKAVDAAPDKDNSAKIMALKKQIQDGTYKTNYDALADKILGEEFNNGI